MLTPHELALVIQLNRIKVAEWLPKNVASSVTIQAALSGLNDKERDAVKRQNPQTFAATMECIGQQQLARKGV